MTSVRFRRVAAIRLLRSLRRVRGSTDAIARGFAAGTFVAFTPTVGMQTAAAALLATLVKGSRAAAILPVWISNPLTFPIVYGTTYQIGRQLWAGGSEDGLTGTLTGFLRSLQVADPWDVGQRVRLVLSLGSEIAIPLWLGGMLIGGIAAIVVYGLTVGTISAARATLRARPRLPQRATQLSGRPPTERSPLP